MLDIKVSAALLGFTETEQRTILGCVKEGKEAPTSRLRDAVAKVTEIIENHEEVIEGYAGFPIEKDLISKNKQKFKDDRNIGRVISQGGQSMVITGVKSDGRYQVVGKKGEKTAKAASDLGLMQREHIDIEDLHQQMVEGMKQARKNVGASTCWDGYKAKGTKKKGGKEVPNCVKEEEIQEKKDCVKAEKKTMHNCAKKVCSEQWGVGECVFGQHAIPDAEGFVAWYDVMFEHGIEKGVDVSTLEVLEEGSHGEHVEHEGQKMVEGYKSIDKKKENAMYRRAGNLARTSLSSKGKKKEDAQNKSSKIVSAIARQKENERFAKMGDEKARSNYKEEVEAIEEKKKGLWDNIHAKRKRGEKPAKPGDKDYPKTLNVEAWDEFVEEIILDEEFDTLTFEQLEEICIEALEELDEELLTEALDSIDSMELLTEVTSPAKVAALRAKNKASAASGEGQSAGRDAGAEARKRLGDKKPAEKPAADKPAAGARREKMKAALKSAGSAVKSGLKKAGKAAAYGAGRAAGTAGRAVKSAASSFKKGYERGSGGASTGRKAGESGVTPASSSSSSSSSSGGSSSAPEKKGPGLRDKIKSGIKKVVGKVARSVSRGARGVARRMSEETTYSWRKEMGIEE